MIPALHDRTAKISAELVLLADRAEKLADSLLGGTEQGPDLSGSVSQPQGILPALLSNLCDIDLVLDRLAFQVSRLESIVHEHTSEPQAIVKTHFAPPSDKISGPF